MIDWRERHTSRRITTNPPGIELQFSLSGEIDDVAAWSYALGNTSPMWITAGQILYRQDVRLDHRGAGLWYVDVPYGPENKQVGQWDFDFDTQGGTIRIFQSKKTTPFPAGAPDHKGAIDVQGDDVRGTEIVIPALRMTYNFRHAAGVVNEAFARMLARNTGRTNKNQWHGFAAGEALFLGANGRQGSQTEASVGYSIACSENVTGLTIGALANIAKRGWESVWISYKDDVDGGGKVKQPEFVYVEQVYDECDFAAVLGF